MDRREVDIIVNQRRHTNWMKEYHENYRKKLEERKNAVTKEEKEKEKRA